MEYITELPYWISYLDKFHLLLLDIKIYFVEPLDGVKCFIVMHHKVKNMNITDSTIYHQKSKFGISLSCISALSELLWENASQWNFKHNVM